MFIFTAHIPKKRLLAGGIVLLCCAAVVATALILTAAGKSVTASAEVRGVRDNEDRVGCLEELGWQVSPEPTSVEDLLVPTEFDDSYADYLALQAGQGFDLTQYRGKRIRRYTYDILNYPDGTEGVQVSLLVYKHTVIGGEVLSPGQGFLHGLSVPS